MSLSTAERTDLENIVMRSSDEWLVERARIVLLAHYGFNNAEIARKLRSNVKKVGRWRKRFAVYRFTGIERSIFRPGRTPAIDVRLVEAVVEKTIRQLPVGAPRWTAARMAEEVGISPSSIRRIWRRHGVTPRRGNL